MPPATVTHDTFLDHLVSGSTWAGSNLTAALFLSSTWTPAASDALMADPISLGAIELTAPSYARTALASVVANLDGTNHREILAAAVIDFGTLETGFDYDTLVIFAFVSDDSDSWLVCSIDVSDSGTPRTTDGTDERFVPNAIGLYALTPL